MKTIDDFETNDELTAYLTDKDNPIPLFSWIEDQLHGEWKIDAIAFHEGTAHVTLGPPSDLPWRKSIHDNDLLSALKRAIGFSEAIDVDEYTREFFKYL